MDITLSPLRLELQLLLACCRLVIAKEEQKRQRAYEDCQTFVAAPAVEWSTVLALAAMHKIHPLLYRALQQADALSVIPTNIRQRLRQTYQRHTQLALAQSSELVRLGKYFQSAAIPVMPLKGPLLSQRLFGEVGVRQPGDLDLLVDPTVLDQAEALLIAAGYRKVRPDFPLTPRQQRVFRQIAHHCNFIHTETKTLVELHWKPFANNFLLSPGYYQQMGERSITLHLADVPFAQFADADLTLYLCLHGAKHQWSRLKWLCDLAAILHNEWGVDWSIWQQTIDQLGLQQPVYESFVLAHHFLAAPLPPPWQAVSSQERRYRQVVQRFAQRSVIDIQAETGGGKVNRIKIESLLQRPALRQNWTYRWHDWRNLWCMVDDWRDFPLPDALFPLYYVLRPFLWFWRYYIPLPPFARR